MKIQEGGNEHSIGDRNCPGCESPEGEQFPQPHRDGVTKCSGLVHAEIFAEESRPLVRRCSIAAMCAANPSEFFPTAVAPWGAWRKVS